MPDHELEAFTTNLLGFSSLCSPSSRLQVNYTSLWGLLAQDLDIKDAPDCLWEIISSLTKEAMFTVA